MDDRRYDADSVKEKLVEYRQMERDIDNQIERLERIVSKMTGVGSQVITDMPRSPSPSSDRITDLVGLKIEMEKSIREAVSDQSKVRASVESIVKHLKNPDERAVIRMRYIDGASWNEVLEMLFGHREDYNGKEDSYLRRVHRVHGSALANMARWLNKSEEDLR